MLFESEGSEKLKRLSRMLELVDFQKSQSRLNWFSTEFGSSSRCAITPARAYSDTFFSKKFVFPSSEIISMKSKGFSTL